ncbi:MAG: alanine--tRNA ligase, partial [Firmicutes bacterium]|nr:alanine--tRNA ligase [Bacillota bacterium]
LLEELEGLRRTAARAEREAAGGRVEEIPLHSLPGGKYAAGRLDGFSMELLREAADRLRERMGSGVAVLAAVTEGRPLFVVGVTRHLASRVKAGELIKQIAAVAGGSGGGRPDFAQAGGKDAGKVDEALRKGVELVKEALG